MKRVEGGDGNNIIICTFLGAFPAEGHCHGKEKIIQKNEYVVQ